MSDRFDEMARDIMQGRAFNMMDLGLGLERMSRTEAIAAALRLVAAEENEACETVARNFVDHDAPRARHVIGERIAARRKEIGK